MFDKIKILKLPTLCDAYKPIAYHVDINNVITPQFGHYDILSQEQFMIDNYNKRNKQGILFI